MLGELILVFAMVTPYFCYSLAYLKAQWFWKFFQSQRQLVVFSSILKAICMILYLHYALEAGFNFHGMLIGLPLAIVGQYLNMLVYNKLGEKRAYYGWELSLYSGPMLTGYPWTIGHAQYKGLLLCVLGVWCCFNPTPKFTAINMLWSLMYFYMIIMESLPPGRK